MSSIQFYCVNVIKNYIFQVFCKVAYLSGHDVFQEINENFKNATVFILLSVVTSYNNYNNNNSYYNYHNNK